MRDPMDLNRRQERHVYVTFRGIATQWLIVAALVGIVFVGIPKGNRLDAQTAEPLPPGGADDLAVPGTEEESAGEVAEEVGDEPSRVVPEIQAMPDEPAAQPNREPPAAGAAPPGDSQIKVPRGYVVPGTPTVQFISEPVLSFQDNGLITKIPKEGDMVTKGDVIATLDETETMLRIEVARAQVAVAHKEATNQVKVKYAERSAEASKADYASGLDANRRARNVVPEMELRRRELEWDAAKLSIENAKYELEVAGLSEIVKMAELKATQETRKRMIMTSPISGIVFKREAHEGQFVRAGDPVIQVAQLDRLRVEALIPAEDMMPDAVRGHRVTLEINVGMDPATNRARWEPFQSTIERTDAAVNIKGLYRVWAEFDNLEGFIVRKGMPAKMTIH